MLLISKLKNEIGQILTLINHLSIDVVVGSVSSYYFFCSVFQTPSSAVTASLLALSIWIIYTVDHLIDSKKMKIDHIVDRHQFHKRHFNVLGLFVVVAVVCGLCLLPFMNFQTLKYGVVTAGAVVLYFISIHLLDWKRLVHKEAMIGMLYTVGIIIGPLSTNSESWQGFQIILLVGFQLIVWANLLLFSLKDHLYDQQKQFASLATEYDIFHIKVTFFILLSGAVVCVILLISLGFSSYGLLLSAMVGLLISLYVITTSSKTFRLIGDSIFILPGIMA